MSKNMVQRVAENAGKAIGFVTASAACGTVIGTCKGAVAVVTHVGKSTIDSAKQAIDNRNNNPANIAKCLHEIETNLVKVNLGVSGLTTQLQEWRNSHNAETCSPADLVAGYTVLTELERAQRVQKALLAKQAKLLDQDQAMKTRLFGTNSKEETA